MADLKKFRKDNKLTQQAVADYFGCGQAFISQIEGGARPLPIEYINKALSDGIFKTDALLVDEVEMPKSITEQAKEDSDGISTGKVIPYYDAEAAAGNSYGMDMTPVKPVGMIEIGGLLKDSESAIRVYGNSMTPNYPAGCVIGTKLHSDSFIEPGNVYVVETADNRYLKRLYYNKERTAFRCISDNHMVHESGSMIGELCFPEFEIPFSEVKRIFRVTGVIKRNIL